MVTSSRPLAVDATFVHSKRFKQYFVKAFPPRLYKGKETLRKYMYVYKDKDRYRNNIRLIHDGRVHVSIGPFKDAEFAASLAAFLKSNLQSITSRSFVDCKNLECPVLDRKCHCQNIIDSMSALATMVKCLNHK